MNSVKLSELRKHLRSNKDIIINNINKSYEQSIKTQEINKVDTNKTNDNSIENIFMSFVNTDKTIADNTSSDNTSSNDTTIKSYIKTSQNKTNSINTVFDLLNQNVSHDKFNDFYIQGTRNTHSYLESIMLCVDSEYQKYKILSKKTSGINNNVLKTQQDISSEALTYIKDNATIKSYYTKNRIKYKEIPQKLFKQNNADVDEDLKLFLADYYKVNILLINMSNKKYRILNDYNTYERTLIFIEHKYKYEPILSVNNSYDFLKNFIINHIEEQIILMKSIGPISKYKLLDLQNIAKELHISIETVKNNKIKKKLKKDLYFEIVNNIKDI